MPVATPKCPECGALTKKEDGRRVCPVCGLVVQQRFVELGDDGEEGEDAPGGAS